MPSIPSGSSCELLDARVDPTPATGSGAAKEILAKPNVAALELPQKEFGGVHRVVKRVEDLGDSALLLRRGQPNGMSEEVTALDVPHRRSVRIR